MNPFAPLAAVLGFIGALGVVQQPQPSDVTLVKGFERFQEWSGLVWAHTPGELDDAFRAIELWSPADLSAARVDLAAMVQLAANGPNSKALIQYTRAGRILSATEMARPESRPRVIKVEDLPDLIALPGPRARGFFDEAEITRQLRHPQHARHPALAAAASALPPAFHPDQCVLAESRGALVY